MATFTAKCNLCLREVGSIADQLVNGRTIRGTAYRILSFDPTFQSAPKIETVGVTVVEGPGDLLDANKKVMKSFLATAPTHFVFQVAFDQLQSAIFQVDRA